jgi:hypothetical protein
MEGIVITDTIVDLSILLLLIIILLLPLLLLTTTRPPRPSYLVLGVSEHVDVPLQVLELRALHRRLLEQALQRLHLIKQRQR